MLPDESDVALKEWAILCKALREGRQVLLFRKGGILDKRGEFEVEHRGFFLFPTFYHAKEEDVVPEARAELGELVKNAPPESEVRLDLFCEVTDAVFTDDEKALKALRGRHVYSDAALDYKYHYRKPGMWVLTVRAHVLPKEIVVPNTAEYAGCVSWVTLDAPLQVQGATPVLKKEAFEKMAKRIGEALGGGV